MLETASSESKNTLLRHYSLKGILPMVQCLVEANADVFAKNEDDWSALTLATRNKKIRVVKYLLNEGGANVDIKDRFGQTALMAAAMDDWPEMVKFFIKQKANLSEKDLRGWTALEYATVFGSNEPRDILFEAQDKLFTKEAEETDSSRLICAVRTSDLAMVKQYVYRNIVDVNSQENDGWTALMQAVENGEKEIVEFLVSKKADVNERDEDNKTAEQHARENDQADLVSLFEKLAAAGNG